MNLATFDEFKTGCEAEGVSLHPDLIGAAAQGHSSYKRSLEPNNIYAAVAEAGHILRKNPGTSLADRPVGFVERADQDIGTLTLARIINASVEPVEASDSDSVFYCTDVKAIDTCNDAETCFTKTLVDISRKMRRRSKDKFVLGAQIIYGEDCPVFLRKACGEPSALSLAPVIINGIPYPAGSLFRLDLTRDYRQSSDSYTLNIARGEVVVMSTEVVAKAAFMRLSAFATEPAQRKAFTSSYFFNYGYDKGKINEAFLKEATIQKIAGAVSKVAMSRHATHIS